MAAWWTGKRCAVKRELRFVIPMKNWSGRRERAGQGHDLVDHLSHHPLTLPQPESVP